MPSNQELERICNLAGYPIYPWAADQLKTRSEKSSKDTRTDNDLVYLANKTAWVRVVSSANLEDKFRNYFKNTYQIALANDSSLAENFILYGGTSTYSQKTQEQATPGMNLRSGLAAYNIVGNNEVKDYGYRPMPGITSVVIDSAGRMGSLRQATINFKVWDKYQLDIMDALYFRLGFTMLIEWGHAKYYDNQGKLQSSEQFMIDPFNKSLTKESINIALSTNTRKSYGNYGGMLGIVTSFNFSMTQDGGYDCTIKAMSLGSVMGNFAINHVSTLSNFYYLQVKSYLEKEKENKREQDQKIIEDERLKAIKEAQVKFQTDASNWAKLNITDPLSNLLFNTNAQPGGDFQVFVEYENSQIIPLRRITNTVTDTGGILNNRMSGSAPLPLDVNYYRNRAKNLLNQFKSTDFHNIASKLSTVNGIEAYYVRDGIIFFGETATTELQNKYIVPKENKYQKQFGNITVKLDTSYLNNIISDAVSGVKIYDVDVKQDKVKPFNNYVDRLLQEEKNVGTGDNSIMHILKYKNDNYKFSIRIEYPGINLKDTTIKGRQDQLATSVSNAKKYFSNPNTEYYIDNIVVSTIVDNYSEIVLSVKDNKDYRIILGRGSILREDLYADLGVIKSIGGPQKLIANKFLSERDAALAKAEQDAKKKKEESEKNIENEYNAETAKTTIESDSTLELMLRSTMLYGINNALYPELLTGKPYENFIQNLFSEGAYAPFFKSKAPGVPNYEKYTDDFYKKYIDGSLNSLERLETNFRYGNNFYLMSGENAYKNDANGNMILKNQLSKDIIPQVNFQDLFKITIIKLGESADLKVKDDSQLSVYINLGLFFMMLNHTSLLYNTETTEKLKAGDVITPMTYLDFNPETNFYLSSINQISLDPYKFLVPYVGDQTDYSKLFEESLLENGNFIKAVTPQNNQSNNQVAKTSPTPLFDFKTQDQLSKGLPQQKRGLDGTQNEYIGKLMYVMVDINYLLNTINGLKTASDSNEAYFQTVIERILTDLNKSMGNYNAFRLSYNDNSNCYVITDDQIQMRPDAQVAITHNAIVEGKDWFEMPIYGKKSIARSFDIRTDISSRLASLIAISSNPGATNQVVNAKNSSDFGVYNTGSFDRYIPMKTTDTSDKKSEASNAPAIELATNFNTVVKSIYSISKESEEQNNGRYIAQDSINRAITYYIDKLAKVKNNQPESVHAMIIPLKSNVTIDGMAGLYPFQIYTIDERILPYRYNATNLSLGPDNLKKIAFSISKITHTISDNQWTTSVDGFMTLLRNQSKEYTKGRDIKPEVIKITETEVVPITDTTTSISTKQLNQSAINTSKSKTLTPEFLNELDKICAELSCNRNDMIRVMYAESRLNPTAEGPKNSKGIPAYGLVQFTPPTYPAIGVRTYTDIPSNAIKQLPFVVKYFKSIRPSRSSYNNLYELYGAVFLPAILTRSNLQNDSKVLEGYGLSAQKISSQNPAIARAAGKKPGDPLTIGDFKKYVNQISYNI
jgi:DNA-binding Xre family transcriptional regulator